MPKGEHPPPRKQWPNNRSPLSILKDAARKTPTQLVQSLIRPQGRTNMLVDWCGDILDAYAKSSGHPVYAIEEKGTYIDFFIWIDSNRSSLIDSFLEKHDNVVDQLALQTEEMKNAVRHIKSAIETDNL